MLGRTSLPLMAATLGLLLHCAIAESPAPNAETARAFAGDAFPGSGSIVVPFEYYKQHIYISVQVNGVAGLIFMLDSGANQNVLSLRASRKLGLQRARLRQKQHVGFGDGMIYTAPSEHVDARVASLSVARSMSVIDLTRLERHLSHTTDGMLGIPFFQRFVVKLDFGNCLMTLFPANRSLYRGVGFRVPVIEARKKFVLIPVILAGSTITRRPALLIVDTGSNATLMVYEPFAHPLRLDSSLAHAQEGKAYGLNGYYPIQRGTISRMQIGNAEAKDVPVDYIEANNGVDPIRRSAGAIGTGLLQGFQAVTFDLSHRQMIFEVKRPPPMSGLVRTETTGR